MPAQLLRDSTKTIGALRALIATAILLPIVLFVLAAYQNRAVLLDGAEQRSTKTAAILEQQASDAMEIYQLVFLRVADYLRSNGGRHTPEETHRFLARLDDDVGQIDAVFVVDRDGDVTSHSRYAPPLATTARDRDYFIHLHEAGTSIYVGAPIRGRLSGEPRFNISHRLVDGSGNFAGAIVVSVAQRFFLDFFRAIHEAPGDTMALVRNDGLILVESPEPAHTEDAGPDPTVRAFLSGILSSSRPIVRVAPTDGVERIYTARRVGVYPLHVVFGSELSIVMARWKRNLLAYGAITFGALLLLLFTTWTALQRAREEQRSSERLRGEIAQRTAAEAARESAEAALYQAQKLEAIGELTGGVAHDFNNLLTVITGSLDRLVQAAPVGEDPKLRKLADAALRASERAARLTTQLLAFARRQPLHPEVLDLNALLKDFRPLLRRAAGEAVEMEFHFDGALWPTRVDRAQFEAALLNLTVNARDAMPTGGTIRITTANVSIAPEQSGKPEDMTAGDFVLVSVRDNGIGVAPENLRRIFDPFFTTKEVGKGSGLGLSQVFGFVKQSGGYIAIESTVDVGTAVLLYLPREHAAGPAVAPGAAAEAASGASRQG